MMCQSTFFKRLLGDENKKEIVIKQVEAPIVQAIIDFAYRGAAAVDLAAYAFELYDAARIFGIKTLHVSRFTLAASTERAFVYRQRVPSS